MDLDITFMRGTHEYGTLPGWEIKVLAELRIS